MRSITFKDALNYGYCSKGILEFIRSNNLSKKDIIKNGISEEKRKEINDCLLDKIFEAKYGK